jgi:hypothetical protein
MKDLIEYNSRGLVLLTISRDHSVKLMISKIMNRPERILLVLTFGQAGFANGRVAKIRMMG